MASTNTNKTILYLSVGGVLVFLAWKLWPSLSKKIGSGSGSSGGAVASSPYPSYNSPQGQSSGQGSTGFPNFPGSGGSGSGGSGSFSSWLNGILNQGYQNAQNIPNTELNLQASLDQQGIPLEPVPNLTDLASYSYDDPNAPWNAGSDVTEYDDTGDMADYSGDGGGGGYDGGDGGGGGEDFGY